MSKPERRGQCRYCGSGSSSGEGPHGSGCVFSTDGFHEEIGDAEHCIRCGSTSYGSGCVFANKKTNPKGYHLHGHGTGKDGKVHCVWCGKVMGKEGVNGSGCLFSPNGKHQA